MRPSTRFLLTAACAALGSTSPSASAGHHKHAAKSHRHAPSSEAAPAPEATPAPVETSAPAGLAAPAKTPLPIAPAAAAPATAAPVKSAAAPAKAASPALAYKWAKPPGMIEGQWMITCEDSVAMVIQFDVGADKTAIGKVMEPGSGAKYGYKQGEEMFKLVADDFGDWVGQLSWRSVAGVQRWDPIRLVASSTVLNATMATDNCYSNLPRLK